MGAQDMAACNIKRVPSTSFLVLDLEKGLIYKVKHLVSLFHYVSLFDLNVHVGSVFASIAR